MEDVNNNFEVAGTAQYISNQGLQNSNAQLVPAGSVNLSCTASVGNVTINRIPLATNQQFNSFLPHQELLPEFLAYELIFRKREIKTLGGTTTFPFISKTTISNFPVHVPPLSIQKQIVERLNKIAEAQKLNDGLIQKADELFQSLLHKELNPAGKDWEIKKLGDVSELVTKGTTPTTYGHQFTSSGIPFLRAEDVNDGEVNHQSVQYHISKETNNFLKRSQTKPSDVLITIAGTIGRVGYVSADAPVMNMNQAVAIVRLKKSINYLYIFFLLQGEEIQKKIFGAKVTGTITNLSLTNIRNFKIPIPPIETQKQIVAKLSAAQEYKKQLLAQKSLLKELFDSVLDKSMKGEMDSKNETL